MSLLDSIKKGLMGEGDEYEDQYIDDGPQMVNNNNSGVGIGMGEETEEPAAEPETPAEGPAAPQE